MTNSVLVENVKPGTVVGVAGEWHYTILGAEKQGQQVTLEIEYPDGGTGRRVFAEGISLPVLRLT
jgi:hypothetical protein